MTEEELKYLNDQIHDFLSIRIGELITEDLRNEFHLFLNQHCLYNVETNYTIVCDERNNPPDIVDQNMIVFRMEEVKKDWPAKRVDGIVYV